jgi:hypothetical protein
MFNTELLIDEVPGVVVAYWASHVEKSLEYKE